MTETKMLSFVQQFTKVQAMVHATAREKGWWDDCIVQMPPRPAEDLQPRTVFQANRRNFGESVALMHSELSEGLEWKRNGDGQSDHIPEFSGVEEEFADVIIRIMDHAEANNLNVAGAVVAKAMFNQQRPVKHGGKTF